LVDYINIEYVASLYYLQNKNHDVASIYTANTTAMMLAAQTRETITLSPLQTTDHTKKSDIASSIKGNLMYYASSIKK
jgi:hypothetical protein